VFIGYGSDKEESMKKALTIFAFFILFLVTIPVFAREGHTGRPGDVGAGSPASREGHTGRPGGGGVVGGASSGAGAIIGGNPSFGGGTLGSSSVESVPGLGGRSNYGGGSYYGSQYWSYQSPWRSFQWFFDLFSFGPFGIF
jgi:hypothetical protein